MPLIDSDTWSSKFISLNRLQFHPANPRIPELKGKASEKEIIQELCSRGGIDHLAKQIAEKGYLRQDRLIVLQQSGKNLVYEGNRRLCALKVLSDPTKAPVHMHRTFKRLSEKAKLPSKIAVEVVPNQFDAEVVMFAKHAGESFTVQWKPIQQAAFITAKVEQGESVDDLCTTYGLKHDDVVRFRAMTDVYRLSRLAPLSADAKDIVDDPCRFPSSTVFERLIWPRKTRTALGIEINDKGQVTVNSTREKFLPILAQMLHDAAKGTIDTRTLNTEDDQTKYIGSINIEHGAGTFTVEQLESENKATKTAKSANIAASDKISAKRVVKPCTRTLPRELACTFQHEKLTRLLKEAQDLEITVAPHAAAFLIRSILEISSTIYLKRQRVWGHIPASNPKHGPSLNDMLEYMNKNHSALKLDATCKSALEALVSRSIKQSKAELDRVVHSPEAVATTESVIQIRELVLPLLGVFLTQSK